MVPRQADVVDLRREFPRGTRVVLDHTNDPHTSLRPGERGVVQLVDGMETVHVKWDSGSSLGVIFDDGDRIHKEMNNECSPSQPPG